MNFWEAVNNEAQNVRSQPVYGVVMGVVTNNSDPKGWGRVKVKIPTHLEGETDWVHVATPMGGPQRGAYFLPEVNDNVLVAFISGDIDKPCVIGSFWNGKQKPPASNSDKKNNIRKINSRCGHEIILDDTAGQEKIEIKDKSGSKIIIKSQDNSIAISCDGKVTITSKGETTIDAKKIKLGKSAKKALVNEAFIDTFNNHTHASHGKPPDIEAVKDTNCTGITKAE